MYNTNFRSGEHAYQWRFFQHISINEPAQEVLHAPNAAAVKETAARIPKNIHKDWHDIKLNAMHDVLHAKADSNKLFKTTSLKSAGYPIIEAVRGDICRSSDMSPTLSASTTPEYYSWANQFGPVLKIVREELMKEAIFPGSARPEV